MVALGLEVPHAHIHLIPIQSENDVDFHREKLKLTPEEFRENCSKTLRIRSCLQKYNYLYYKRIVGY